MKTSAYILLAIIVPHSTNAWFWNKKQDLIPKTALDLPKQRITQRGWFNFGTDISLMEHDTSYAKEISNTLQTVYKSSHKKDDSYLGPTEEEFESIYLTRIKRRWNTTALFLFDPTNIKDHDVITIIDFIKNGHALYTTIQWLFNLPTSYATAYANALMEAIQSSKQDALALFLFGNNPFNHVTRMYACFEPSVLSIVAAKLFALCTVKNKKKYKKGFINAISHVSILKTAHDTPLQQEGQEELGAF